MTDLPGAADAAAAIHAAFSRPVLYVGAGLVNGSIAAVRSHRPGDMFMQGGGSVRELWFELRKAALPGAPANGDLLVEQAGAGSVHKVIEVVDRDDVDAWLVKVEATDELPPGSGGDPTPSSLLLTLLLEDF